MSKRITSITQLKKILKVGDKLKIVYHVKDSGFNTDTNLITYKDEVRPVREVSAVDESGFELSFMTTEQIVHTARTDYPKPKYCKAKRGKLTLMGSDMMNPEVVEDIPILTIEIV